MSIPMWHEIFKVIFIALAGMLVGVLAGYHLLHKFAEITYKKAHKKLNKVQPRATKQYKLILSKDQEKNITLSELKEIKAILGGI